MRKRHPLLSGHSLYTEVIVPPMVIVAPLLRLVQHPLWAGWEDVR